ncbi:MAG: sigma-70 family RNA polymerase sigma factor [Candidatus Omnitrophota bacterium]|jgi:RNA polymerase sigma factor (sigma-70 family)
MGFDELFTRVSPKIKRIARRYNRWGTACNYEDLYQEMSVYLWGKFKTGVPEGINESYIVKGCRFHILNYLRKTRENVVIFPLEERLSDEKDSLRELLPDYREPLDERIDEDLIVEHILNNGFSPQEKQVFAFMMKGYTVREIGGKMGISHVMVIKISKKMRDKCRGLRGEIV